jgi:CRP-like cAMP-binding protein
MKVSGLALKNPPAIAREYEDETPVNSSPRINDCWQNLLPPPQSYPAGIGLFCQGSSAREVYYVDHGLVKLVWVDPNGHEFILGLRHAGAFLGLAPVILDIVHPVSAITMARSRLVRVPASTFLSFVKNNAEISSSVHEILSREVCDQSIRMAELGCLSSRERVKQMLRHIVQVSQRQIHKTTRSTRFLLPLRQCELASMLAVTPEHLSRILKQLREEGIIRWHKGWLVVPDVNRLQG